MMRIATLTGAALLTLLTACASTGDEAATTAKTETGQNLGLITATPVAGWEVYGGDVSDADPITVEALLSSPMRYDGQTLVVEGEIGEACPKKGCWMTLDAGGEQLRVTFQDYAFFVPIESAGRTARFEGTFRITEIPEEEAKHYLEDAGKYEEAEQLSGPQKTFSLVATGVRIRG
jgi:hypothetical protein